MLNFVKRAFRKWYEISLWINLVFCIIIGGVSGYIGVGLLVDMIGIFGGGDSFVWKIVGAVVGLIIGAVVGLLTNVFVGGLVATFLEIGEDIANIKTSSAGTTAVFQQMANRQAAAANAGGKA
jgi:hypothetical protein